MEIIFKRSFVKSLKKLPTESQKKVNSVLKVFQNNPFDPKLRNHKLKGKFDGVRSITVAYDLRILYEEFDDHIKVIMLDIGTHDEVY